MSKSFAGKIKHLILVDLSSKLRYKLMVLLVIVIILPIIIGITLTYYSIKANLQKIEVDQATINVKSVNTYIDSLVFAHGQNYVAWTMWTEYYDAIESKDLDWIDTNILSMTKENTPNETLITLDKTGSVLGQSNAPKDWENINFKNFGLMKKLNQNTHYASGVIKTSEGIYIATIVENVKSEDENFEMHDGYTIYARKLTDGMVDIGKKVMNVNIALKFEGGLISTLNGQAIGQIDMKDLKTDEIYTISKYTKDNVKIMASQLYYDLDGNSIGILTAETTSQAGVAALNKLFQFSMILILLVLILSIFAMLWLNHYVVEPILKVTEAAEAVGNKDLTTVLTVKGKDEIARLSSKFNEMIKGQRIVITKFLEMSNIVGNTSIQVKSTSGELSSIIQNQSQNIEDFTASIEYVDQGIQEVKGSMSKLASNASSVSAAIGEMGNATQDTARNVEEAAAAISEVTASMEQMDVSINSIVEHSKDAQSEAIKTVGKAKEGNMAVGYAIQKMDKISNTVGELSVSIKDLGQAAEKIGEIINVIDDIAEQTNLLSLNASIEAARAGDAGRGFAVVANAIRELAQKSGEATKDISHLVKGIQGKVKNSITITKESEESVKEGSQYVKGTGQVFEDIYNAINNTGEIINDIAGSISTQKEGSKEIVKAVEKISDLVNHLSATIEQQAAGSDEIVRSVEKINELMHGVSSTTEEQAASSQEVVRLIKDINENSEEISSSSQGIAQSIAGLSEQAEDLVKIINEYKLS